MSRVEPAEAQKPLLSEFLCQLLSCLSFAPAAYRVHKAQHLMQPTTTEIGPGVGLQVFSPGLIAFSSLLELDTIKAK